MTLIEGIGDEVIQVLAICFITTVSVIAWRSTAIRELPSIRTVLILERRSQNSSATEAANSRPTNTPVDTGQNNEASNSNSDSTVTESHCEETPSTAQASTSPTLSELQARRVAYFANTACTSSTADSSEAPENSTENERDVQPNTDSSDAERSIRIKLKYFNDDQKIVEGNLQELLGEFKRRYFEAELSSNKSVLLIFQGRVLREEQTLQTIGMYDNCVVHCLVKNGASSQASGPTSMPAPADAPPAEWDLSTILSTTISIMIITAWFTQISYPQFFTITTTSALVCLTALYTVIMIVMYFPQFLPS